MNNTTKIILLSVLIVALIGAAFLIGRGIGGSIEKQVGFSITVNPSGSFELAVNPANAVCTKGDVITFTVTNTPTGGFDASIQYTLAGLPEGSYSFSKTIVAAGENAVITVDTSFLTSNTSYACTLTGVDI